MNTFPASKSSFKIKGEYYMIQSTNLKPIVYGPKIVLTKQTYLRDHTGDSGDRNYCRSEIKAAPLPRVNITDTVPDDVTLLTGSTMLEDYLRGNKEINTVTRSDQIQTAHNTLPDGRSRLFWARWHRSKINTEARRLNNDKTAPNTCSYPDVENQLLSLKSKPPSYSCWWTLRRGGASWYEHYSVPVVDGIKQPISPEISEHEPVKTIYG